MISNRLQLFFSLVGLITTSTLRRLDREVQAQHALEVSWCCHLCAGFAEIFKYLAKNFACNLEM